MNVILPLILLATILTLTALVTWGVTEIHRLQQKNLRDQAHAESTRRLFTQFIHKLSTEAKPMDALMNVAAQMQEDVDAESIGIFIPDVTSKNLVLRGAACTGYFPMMSDITEETYNDKMFENAKHRLAFFRREIVTPGVGLLGHVVETREPMLLNLDTIQLTNYSLPSGITTMMLLPLTVEDKFAGIVCAVNRNHTPLPFNNDDFKLFTQGATMVALTSSLILIYAERDKQNRIQHELNFTIELQKILLPDIPKTINDIAIAAVSKPCHEVSGDFYDYLELDNNKILVMVADATGKGISACMLTSSCRSFVRSLAERYINLKQFMLDLNRLVFSNSDEAHYLTANVMVIDKKTYMCEFGCAGHTPLFMTDENGTFKTLKPEGPAFGMWPKEFADYETVSFLLKPGMRLCSFTDGFNEALNSSGEEYGYDRLQKAWKCAHALPEQTINDILLDVSSFTGQEPQSDDQTMMAIARQTTC